MNEQSRSVLFSSKTDKWATPISLFETLNEKYQFELDVCATADNAKCEKYYSPEDDGLVQPWHGHMCWMNPPYGREIGQWVEKAAVVGASGRGAVVALLPVRTDTKWWQSWIHAEGEPRPKSWVASVSFIKGRLKFGDAKNGAPFPSAVVTFGPDYICNL